MLALYHKLIYKKYCLNNIYYNYKFKIPAIILNNTSIFYSFCKLESYQDPPPPPPDPPPEEPPPEEAELPTDELLDGPELIAF